MLENKFRSTPSGVTEVPDIASDRCLRLDVCRWQIGPIGQTKLWCALPIDLSDLLGARRDTGKRRGGLCTGVYHFDLYPKRRWTLIAECSSEVERRCPTDSLCRVSGVRCNRKR